MEKKTRKYYRVTIRRIPPYYPVNGDYYYEEDVWAYSEEGATKKIYKQYKGCFGDHTVTKIVEVTKEEFRGDKVTKYNR